MHHKTVFANGVRVVSEHIPHAKTVCVGIWVDVGTPQTWHWAGPTDSLEQWCERLDAPDVLAKARRLAGRADAG
jgi:hypothetical protein